MGSKVFLNHFSISKSYCKVKKTLTWDQDLYEILTGFSFIFLSLLTLVSFNGSAVKLSLNRSLKCYSIEFLTPFCPFESGGARVELSESLSLFALAKVFKNITR